MRIRSALTAILIGAGLLLPQTAALAKKTSYKQPKHYNYKVRKFKAKKFKVKKYKAGKFKAPKAAKQRRG